MSEMQAVFITGASSGIGEALAEAYAEPGVILGLAARRTDRLRSVADQCRKLGASVHCYTLDVRDAEGTRSVAKQFLRVARTIDIVIANAGVGQWKHPLDAQAEEFTAMVDVNVNGVINTLSAFTPTLAKQGHGQLVAISSIAGFRGLPSGVYSATKVAVRYLLDGWRLDLEPYGVGVTSIFPGYITSEMTYDATAWYPFLISAADAAHEMKRAIARRQRTVVLPWQWWLVLPFLRLVPSRIIGLLSRRRNAKSTIH
ncbi:MAG: SDR family NAD(P)-dependent oxidoreductase [Patescibacteria group bacterium]